MQELLRDYGLTITDLLNTPQMQAAVMAALRLWAEVVRQAVPDKPDGHRPPGYGDGFAAGVRALLDIITSKPTENPK